VAELLSGIFGAPASTYYDTEIGISTVSVYLQHKLHSSRKIHDKISAGLKRIRSCGLKTGPGKIAVARMRRQDWAESWKRHFKPIDIGGSLLLKPSWSRRKPRKGQAVIVLDPGLSFGTGHHPTTAFCLGEIVRLEDGERARHGRSSTRLALNLPVGGRGVRRNARGRACSQSFLDLGTGSGILAIAAAKLGYTPVHALDFDPEAVRIARVNARANHVQKLKIRRGDVTKLPDRPRQPGQRYDLVCANLISDLLIRERRRIAAQLKRSGTLVLAGILRREFAEVQKAYEGLGLKLDCRRIENEWCSGSFRFGLKIRLNGGAAEPV